MYFKNVFKRNKNKRPLKEKITIHQQEEKLVIEGSLSLDYYKVKELWLKSRQTEKEFKVSLNSSEGNIFKFNANLEHLISLINECEDENFDWFLKINVPVSELSEAAADKLREKADFINEGNIEKAEYLIRLGRFKTTDIKGIQSVNAGGHTGICYLTDKGNLSLLLDKVPALKAKLQIDKIKGTKKSLKVEGKLFSKGSEILNGTVILKGRNHEKEIELPLSFQLNKEETEAKYGLHRYFYSFLVNFEDHIVLQNIKEDVYDLFLKLDFHDQPEETYLRVGRPAFRARHFLKECYAFLENKAYIITPYYTFKASNLSLEIFEFNKSTFEYLQQKLRFSWLYNVLGKTKDIWLVGERPYKAQDTGYHFFKYMRKTHPDKNVYYVIEEDSPERRNVEPLGNVLIFKSKEHILKSLMASRIIGSHHPDYLYPVRTRRFKKAVSGIKVFLQHGVMGTKNMIANYGKKAPGFKTDLFLVSSKFEKEMIVNDFGYDKDEVMITGLSRFDRLFDQDVELKRQILIIPTWRDWIVTEADFLESEYFQRYRELVYNPELHALKEEFNLDIVLCLHPNMQRFTSFFQDAPVKVINQGEVDVQHLLKESALMVTDYSSVAFDFSFLYKPVLYYQFDRNRFIGKRPSHLDLDNDLPGDIFDDPHQLISKIREYTKNNFKASEENKRKADKFLMYRDQKSSERIYTAVRDFKVKKNVIQKISEIDILISFFNRFRRSKYYFPAMKAFYYLAKMILPVDNRLILFESGVGKQYADSPRNIYEEIVERGLDYKKVWVINKNIRFNDPGTIKVKRLSPQYYYYLARAGFWINNQNFPTYINKRKGTTYIQTWHGTPLKKMLFDIENIQGRDETYLERVHSATKNWDYLISPSKYATNAFRSAFRYNGEMLEVGYPRNDLFYQSGQQELADRIRKQLKLPADKKIILYAPTFRDNETKGKNKFQFSLNMDLHQLKKELGNEYILLMRMHVVISNKLSIPDDLKDFVYNVSSYPDIQELYLISDLLMTDYSSVMFDFANTGKPLLFFTYDLEQYKNDIRGFYMDFEEEAPGPFLFNTDDITNAVKNIHLVKEEYKPKYSAFRDKYCPLEDGNASKRVVDRFFN
ncbi:CDP-glycerol glycerophosphotransferase family protein [Cytobacillus firmus]|uniref:CDP-glycerol glycerophosphotransferase family protein n=1 Tax=Cytobacillus firmus TaxID=1399 RepID=A0AA46P0I0_CYTFI|nr:CDP-glycerol glycerophosphotransferase family protein [Cytobacillus firmus]UYG93851.1 CDP-glycerol glycerophosphotransferase family protein [Cytobacillus firmus]